VPNSKGQPSVYVSSTFIDLEGHRAALKTALEKARYDVECMEEFTAFDERPLDRAELPDRTAPAVVNRCGGGPPALPAGFPGRLSSGG
jgi:hypothetical protein